HTHGAVGKQRDGMRLGPLSHECLLFERPRSQRRASDQGSLRHDGEEVDLRAGARADADHDDAASLVERGQVVGHVDGANQLEDHVVRPAVGEVVVGDDFRRTEAGDAVPQAVVAHRRRHTGACRGGQLHGRGADASRGAVHEHTIADGDTALREERVVGGQKRFGEPARLGEGDGLRDPHRHPLVHNGELGLGPAADHGHHPVALGKGGDGVTDAHHLAGQLQAGDVGRAAGRRRIEPLHLDQVRVVEAGGTHANQQLALPRLGIGVVPDLDLVVDDGGRSHARHGRRTFAVMRVPLTVGDFLQRADAIYGDRIGLIDEPSPPGGSWESLTWRQVHDRARNQAAALDRLGVGRGERVAIVSPNAGRFLTSFFGVSGFGRILVPINFRLNAEEISYILDHSGASVLLVDPELDESLATVDVKHRFVLGAASDDELFNSDAEPEPWDDPDEDATATINYTSGTTARPKGVQLTHRNVWINAVTFGLHTTISDRDVYLHTLPMFHCNGWGMPYALAGVG